MQKKGFTLVELLVVLALIAILAAVLIVVIRPAEIFRRGRDTQRQGDLRNLAAAVDAYLTEVAINPSLAWPARGSCSNIFFSVTTTANPTGWPTMPSGYTATGTTSNSSAGTGWVPLNFNQVSVINLPQLPLDPRNGQTGTVNGTNVTFAYAFSCSPDFNYEFAAKLEGPTSTMAADGGNRNCTTSGADCLYEVGPGKGNLY
ncbi:MAG: hypothetical protein KatS3mg096_325 [Candidatus Parcubacteria bacterium]|nr:MAG: hypothetical protein KatS3mg096_325 [Candidatus Parcubacteria bacterium]